MTAWTDSWRWMGRMWLWIRPCHPLFSSRASFSSCYNWDQERSAGGGVIRTKLLITTLVKRTARAGAITAAAPGHVSKGRWAHAWTPGRGQEHSDRPPTTPAQSWALRRHPSLHAPGQNATLLLCLQSKVVVARSFLSLWAVLENKCLVTAKKSVSWV